jgi:hypothetical protein
MSEHVHLEQVKFRDSGRDVIRTIVRRKFADDEIAIARQMGYEVEARYCGDLNCLGPEPRGRA